MNYILINTSRKEEKDGEPRSIGLTVNELLVATPAPTPGWAICSKTAATPPAIDMASPTIARISADGGRIGVL
jgi:hypothetical protein